jgi:hypothetical protein
MAENTTIRYKRNIREDEREELIKPVKHSGGQPIFSFPSPSLLSKPILLLSLDLLSL